MCEGSVANVRVESFGGSFANKSSLDDSIPDEDDPTASTEFKLKEKLKKSK
jgi:hypothetical protein